MGFFNGSKKTYSGVGSAIQNLLSYEPEDVLTTTVVSAQVNNSDLGDAFKKSLSTGNGLKLRSVIDYAHQKGYTNALNWHVSNITGEVFSDSTAYVNYLQNYVYPSNSNTVETPETLVSDNVTNLVSYRLGNDEIIEKTYTRTTTKTVTTTSTTYSPLVNLYYQGSHTEYIAINNLINSDTYKNLSDNMKDTAISVTGDIYVAEAYYGDDFTYFPRFDNATLLLLSPKITGYTYTGGFFLSGKEIPIYENIPGSISGTLWATSQDVMDQSVSWWVEKYGQDWNDESYSVDGNIAEYLYTHTGYRWIQNQDCMTHPVSVLGLENTNNINICKVKFLLGAKNYYSKYIQDDHGGGSYPDRKSLSARLVYFNGYALVCANGIQSNERILLANVTFNKVITKITSVITSETVVTEKYINGVLVSSSSIEGAKKTDSKQETLENSTFTHIENYYFGSGNNKLDEIINNTSSITEQFMPMLPIKTWGNLCSSSWGNLYDLERKVYRKLTGKTLSAWDSFVDSFKNVGNDAKMIYYWPSIPINVDNDFANEYIYHFFKWLAVNFNGMNYFGSSLSFGFWADNNTDFNVGYAFKVTYKMVSGKPPIPCDSHGYARYHKIGGQESNDKISKSWQGGFHDNYRRWIQALYTNLGTNCDPLQGSAEDYPSLTTEQYNNLKNSNKHTYTVWAGNDAHSSISLYYKVNDELYEKLYITNFVQIHYVRGTSLFYHLKNSLSKNWRDAIDDDATNDASAGFSPIVIPIARGALESMGWYRQSNILELCHNVIISGYDQQTVREKWYQTAFFNFCLIIVIVVITIYCGPAGGAASSTTSGAGAGAAAEAGAAAGATATTTTWCGITMSASWAATLNAISCALICKTITYAANKWIGGVFGNIVGAIGSFVACYYFVGFSSTYGATQTTSTAASQTIWDYCCSFDGFTSFSKCTVDAVQKAMTERYAAKMDSLQTAYEIQQAEQEAEAKQLQIWERQLNSLRHDDTLSTVIDSSYALAEDPDTYRQRVSESDFIEANIAFIRNNEELLNNITLPS